MAERILYHFKMSPFSRRARLALAHKGLLASTELRDARADTSHMDEVKRLSALSTVPVFVDGGRAIVDSTSLLQYLDAAYPDAPALYPKDLDALARSLETVALVDAIVNPIVDLASRYFWLATSDAWPNTVAERRARVEEAFARLVELSSGLAVDGAWGGAEITLFSALAWFGGLRGRLGQTPAIERILALEIVVPERLAAWAAPHYERDDVKAL